MGNVVIKYFQIIMMTLIAKRVYERNAKFKANHRRASRLTELLSMQYSHLISQFYKRSHLNGHHGNKEILVHEYTFI